MRLQVGFGPQLPAALDQTVHMGAHKFRIAIADRTVNHRRLGIDQDHGIGPDGVEVRRQLEGLDHGAGCAQGVCRACQDGFLRWAGAFEYRGMHYGEAWFFERHDAGLRCHGKSRQRHAVPVRRIGADQPAQQVSGIRHAAREHANMIHRA